MPLNSPYFILSTFAYRKRFLLWGKIMGNHQLPLTMELWVSKWWQMSRKIDSSSGIGTFFFAALLWKKFLKKMWLGSHPFNFAPLAWFIVNFEQDVNHTSGRLQRYQKATFFIWIWRYWKAPKKKTSNNDFWKYRK